MNQFHLTIKKILNGKQAISAYRSFSAGLPVLFPASLFIIKKNFMKKIIFTSIIFLFLFFNIGSTQVTQQWASRYTGPGASSDDYASSLALDGLGNVYTTGWVKNAAGNYDYIVLKYNSAGVQQWVAIYNGPGNDHDEATSIAVDASGNVYITGESYGSGTAFDYCTIKYNTDGVQQWVQRYNGPDNSDDIARQIVVDAAGNVFITGTSGPDMATIKYNSAGVQQWVKRWNTAPIGTAAAANGITLDASGSVCITGWKDALTPALGRGLITIKYSSAGDTVWTNKFIANTSSTGNVIVSDNSGNFYVTGKSQVASAVDYITLKYNSAGVIQWTTLYNSTSGQSMANSIAVGKTGNVYVTGYSPNSGTFGYKDYCTIKYSPAGAEQWVQRFNNSNQNSTNHIAYSIAVDTLENVYVTGDSPLGGEGSDFVTVKYNTAGAQQWMARYNGPSNNTDIGNFVKVDAAGNIYVAGFSYGSGTNTDLATIKYSQSTGINTISSTVPDNYSLSQNYPNPFNPTTKINFELQTSGNAILKIYNSLGSEVAVLVNERLSAGKYSVDFNASNFSGGVYFYRLEAQNFSKTKKMMLVK